MYHSGVWKEFPQDDVNLLRKVIHKEVPAAQDLPYWDEAYLSGPRLLATHDCNLLIILLLIRLTNILVSYSYLPGVNLAPPVLFYRLILCREYLIPCCLICARYLIFIYWIRFLLVDRDDSVNHPFSRVESAGIHAIRLDILELSISTTISTGHG
ncbi:hypothetical protein BJX76DRAFT_195772 [Aspergillus varians]